MPRNDGLETVFKVIIRPEYKEWEILRKDNETESFDVLKLFQSFLECEIDLDSATQLFDSVIEELKHINQTDKITHSRIYDTVLNCISSFPHENSRLWLSNYTSIFGIESLHYLDSDKLINIRQKGILKKHVLQYLCGVYDTDDESEIREILGDTEFTILAERMIKIIRFCGFYSVDRVFLYKFFDELEQIYL